MDKTEILTLVDIGAKLFYGLIAAGLYLLYKKFLSAKIDKEQLKQIIFWIESFAMWAENTFKGEKLGPIKEDKVIQSLRNIGITIPDDMLKSLIKIVVDNFNQTNWKKKLFDIDEESPKEKEVVINVVNSEEKSTVSQ